jgi:lipoyl(octanoyl) transferase
MDLSPFRAINPCGYPGLEVTKMRDLPITDSTKRVGAALVHHLIRNLQ